jgi:ABC-type phosphate/phosphonate transport system substrate-binding protein
MRNCPRIRTAVLIALLLVGLLAPPVRGDQETLRIGFTTDMFPEVSRKDAEIALLSWTKEIMRLASAPMAVRSLVFESGDTVADAVLRRELDVFGMTTPDYLRWKDKLQAIPRLVGDHGQGPEDEYLLLVRQGSSLGNLRQLAGKRLLAPAGAPGILSHAWLDVLLTRQGLPAAIKMLADVRSVSRPSHAVLPVFFRQADAAMVTAAAFATMQELNPQIGREMVVLARSPKLLPSLMLFDKETTDAKRTLVTESALRLAESVTGKQVLLLFKISRVVSFGSSQLDNVVALMHERAGLHPGRNL